MRDLNIIFLDLYKSVDRFIRDAYSSTEGVSTYIRVMEENDRKGQRYVKTWSADLATLKHVRWIRNQLAHEVSYDSDICKQSDYADLEDFYQRLFSASDPLALMDKNEKAEIQRRRMEQKQKQARSTEQQPEYTEQTQRPSAQNTANDANRKLSLWQKIVRFFTGL